MSEIARDLNIPSIDKSPYLNISPAKNTQEITHTEKFTPEETESAEPLTLTRQERIQIALAKKEMSGAKLIGDVSASLPGQALGAALAFAALPTVASVNIGIILGGIASFALSYTESDKKIAGKLKEAEVAVLSPAKQLGRQAGEKLSQALKIDKPQNSSEEIKKPNILLRGAAEAAKIVKGLPDIIYPSIQSEAAEKQAIIEALDKLPLQTVTSTNSIEVAEAAFEENVAGYAVKGSLFDSPIRLKRSCYSQEIFGDRLIFHEIGHTRDFAESPLFIKEALCESHKAPWGTGDSVTEYAKTSHWEDFAETHEAFFSPSLVEDLKAKAPEKYEAMKKFYEPDLYDKFLDKPGIRQAGKEIAEAIDKVPGLRIAMGVASFAMGPLMIKIGLDNLNKNKGSGDIKEKFNAKLTTAQGLAYTTAIFAPAGLAISLGRWALNHKVKHGKLTPEKADEISTKVLAATAGPIGTTYLAAVKSIEKPAKGTTNREFRIEEDKDPGKKSKIAKILNLKKYKVSDPQTGKVISPEESKLQGKDILFMTEVGSGAVAGGIGGTLIGMEIGDILGAVVGGALLGPAGAAAGAFCGKVLGSVIVSYQGAKIGAKAGRLLDKEAREQDL